MKIGNNGNLVLGPFDESTPCLMIVLMNCQTKLRINHLTAFKSVAILESLMYGYACYGTSQIEVQRLLSLSNVKRAKSTLLISILPVIGLYLLCNLYGLILYSVYHLCDPISNKKATGLTKYDQVSIKYEF
ncbi:alpha-2 adrenergic receptor [Trichonephila clavipes]|uniref:Alpha-2 adrenergic receptor n=1 Tax=Trichonephila clavipes TaxID=2585209 RepID=A0A8X6S3S7_TRICX|nr:alpha-2 adrenergic receptor [Trichonephila clavipes]